MDIQALEATIRDIAIPGKGILAADESTGTIKKRFDSIQIESTEENRQAYRDLLFTAPKIEDYISGVILYDETLRQNALDGTPFPQLLANKNIVPGIKVDLGLIPNESSPEEKATQGLDGLPARLDEYRTLGARFAKWRCVYSINDQHPSHIALNTNACLLARYAAMCQQHGIVPIVEPEVLMDGTHSLERCEAVTENVLRKVFDALYRHHVGLELMILKPSMVIAGKDYQPQPSVEAAAKATIRVLKRTVPAAVPTINFLSGGQSDEIATQHLNVMNQLGHLPWYLSFSYGRALQAPALKLWAGKKENVAAAQQALIKRAKLNGLAAQGTYTESMEQEQ